MEQLESLDLTYCHLQEDQLSWLLQRFPNLEELSFDGSGLTRFDPTGKTDLKSVRTTTLENVEDIRIVDLPLLKAHIRMSRTPLRMEIRNAQSLRGLAVQAPWPTNAKISGLRDLEWFAGGGEAIGDGLVDARPSLQKDRPTYTCLRLDHTTKTEGNRSTKTAFHARSAGGRR